MAAWAHIRAMGSSHAVYSAFLPNQASPYTHRPTRSSLLHVYRIAAVGEEAHRLWGISPNAQVYEGICYGKRKLEVAHEWDTHALSACRF